MHNYASPAIHSLARQLLRGPKRLRLRQLLNIEFLLSLVEPEKGYPVDFVQHVVTGYRQTNGNMSGDGELIAGHELLSDLVLLAESLSDDARVSAASWAGRVFSIHELSERFDVSTKTIFRWRRRGLVGWKFRYEDNRTRIVFPDFCVRRFVAQNTNLVHRGSSFSQLTDDERAAILVRARALREGEHLTLNAAARRISSETGRAVETVRLILKAFDEGHPGAGIFNRSALEATVDHQRLAVWEAYEDGAELTELAARFHRPVAWVYRTITQMRARELQTRVIEYIASPEFEQPELAEEILNDPAAKHPYRTDGTPVRRIPTDLPPYLQQLFRLPLLCKEGEVALFRKMNYLKHRADELRGAYDPADVTAGQLDEIENLLDQAVAIKNQITQANLRLVVSLAKRHMTHGADFFEIVSDGNMSLMRAVEKFDYTRGFKFSTYGSWAIMRNYARMIPEKRHHLERYQTGREELLDATPSVELAEQDADQLIALRRTVDRMLDVLDDREQRILRQRFGLDGSGQPQTLEQIGRTFGVSKERIRQLESRAINRLRTDFQADVSQLLNQ